MRSIMRVAKRWKELAKSRFLLEPFADDANALLRAARSLSKKIAGESSDSVQARPE